MANAIKNVHKRTQAWHSCEEGNMVMGCCKNLKQELRFNTKPSTLTVDPPLGAFSSSPWLLKNTIKEDEPKVRIRV